MSEQLNLRTKLCQRRCLLRFTYLMNGKKNCCRGIYCVVFSTLNVSVLIAQIGGRMLRYKP